MARADEYRGRLVGCPTCGTKVDDAELRLRDFGWANEKLPGKVGGMDVDFVLSSAKTGRSLMAEMKPENGFVSKGALLTYREFVKMGTDVWVLRGPDTSGRVTRSILDKYGREKDHETFTLDAMGDQVGAWWEENSK